ncbi:MAG: hypothetical protein Q4B78_05445, partial [Bacillota bacterium]|nr:hypothetical protein [Bacillota bacterium]
MQDLFNKLSKAASSAATTASDKANEMRQINKLKSEQTDLKNEYSSVKKKLADYVFKKFQDGELTDETLMEFCNKMQDLRDQIDKLDLDIQAVRDEYEEKSAQ